MGGKLNWWRANKLYRRGAVDLRYEHDVPDRADRWLAAVERRQAQRRQRPRERRSFSGSTQAKLALMEEKTMSQTREIERWLPRKRSGKEIQC